MNIGIISLVTLIIMMVFLSTGIPVAFAVGIAGLAAFYFFAGDQGLLMAQGIPFYHGFSFELLAIPFFILMGHFLDRSGIISRFFQTTSSWLTRIPGALGIATLFVCGTFAAVLGSGAAATATMSTVAYPRLLELRYDKKISLGILAAGGSLGPVIPPSGALIVYGTLAEQSVTRLFMAALVPGIIAMLVMMVYILIRAILNPSLAPQSTSVSWSQKIASLRHVFPVITLILMVLGTIYAGWATPSEAAALGATGAFILMISYRAFSWDNVRSALRETILTSSFILIIIVFALTMSTVLTYYNFPGWLVETIGGWHVPNLVVFIFLVLIYLILGMFIDGMSMIVITVPLLAPALEQLGFNLIWFGIVLVLLVEIGTMTPPFGMHLYIVKGITKSSFTDVTVGTLPYVGIWLGIVIILYFFPILVLWLPNLFMPTYLF